MMNDTTVNFFETVKAFREYYEVHTMPVEASETSTGDGFEREIGLEKEKEKMDAKERAREHEHELNRARRKSASGKPQLAAEVRAFRGWYFETKPWVREDGVIIGPVQRQQIVDRQQQELREIEKANGKK
jgi:hypothetical protein